MEETILCLPFSRFVYGEYITEEKLAVLDQVEQLLFDKGFRQARVHIHDRLARIEVLTEDLGRFANKEIREEITTKLKIYGFTYVSVDLKGYHTGSINETLPALASDGKVISKQPDYIR